MTDIWLTWLPNWVHNGRASLLWLNCFKGAWDTSSRPSPSMSSGHPESPSTFESQSFFWRRGYAKTPQPAIYSHPRPGRKCLGCEGLHQMGRFDQLRSSFCPDTERNMWRPPNVVFRSRIVSCLCFWILRRLSEIIIRGRLYSPSSQPSPSVSKQKSFNDRKYESYVGDRSRISESTRFRITRHQ